MRRRKFLAGFGSVGAVAVAGCSSGTGGGVNNSTKGNNSVAVGDANADVEAFVAGLEAAGVDVDSTMGMLGGLSVMYWYDPEKHRQDIVRTADVFVEYRHLTETLLTMTAVMPDGDSRHGRFTIPHERARKYNEGAINAETYHQQTIDTYTRV